MRPARPSPAPRAAPGRRDIRTRDQRGFSLVEVLVAATVVGLALTAGAWTMSATTRASEVFANEPLTPALVAREIHTLALGLPKTPAGITGATSGAQVLALDALIGARFSPPLRADRTADASLTGWTQEVDLAVHALANVSVPSADDPAAGLPPDAPKLYRLSVRVLEDGAPRGDFSWWIAP